MNGQISQKTYHLVSIFTRNNISGTLLNAYQVTCGCHFPLSNRIVYSFQASIFDYSTGDFVTYSDYDEIVTDSSALKFRGNVGSLDIAFNSSAGNASWHNERNASGNLRPFIYDLHLPGRDILGTGPFSINITADMQNSPTAYGASTLLGNFTFYSQQNTLTYFQTGPKISGNITYRGITEPVTGAKGHIDRQIFPQYAGVHSPTGRQRSHQWSNVNLNNGIDLAIWQQYDRTNNTLIDHTGVTIYNGDLSPAEWYEGLPSDHTTEFISYSKYPRGNFSTLIPPPSQNMWMPASHIVRSASLNMELNVTYLQPTPAVTLPVEYFEGPAFFNGTFRGTAVSGVGIYESTLALYRDWELAPMLYDSVAHLPDSYFSSQMSKVNVTAAIAGIFPFVSSIEVQDVLTRPVAALYILGTLRPAIETLNDGTDKSKMLEMVDDLTSSLTIVLEY